MAQPAGDHPVRGPTEQQSRGVAVTKPVRGPPLRRDAAALERVDLVSDRGLPLRRQQRRPIQVDEQRIIGSRMGSTRLQIDVPKIVELYKQGRVKLDELVTKTYPLGKINEAIEAVVQGKALRNVIVF